MLRLSPLRGLQRVFSRTWDASRDVDLLRDEQRRFLGYYPVFRSEKMKPFGRDDCTFFKAAAGYGVKTAALNTEVVPNTNDPFVPFHQIAHGIVLTDRDGKVLSLNSVAYSIFRQFALYDGWGANTSVNDSIETLSRYITNRLRLIFGNYETATEAGVPMVKIHSHRSGATL